MGWVNSMRARGLSHRTMLVAVLLRSEMIPSLLGRLPRIQDLPEDALVEVVELPIGMAIVSDGYQYSVFVSQSDGRYWIQRSGGIGGRIELFGPGGL